MRTYRIVDGLPQDSIDGQWIKLDDANVEFKIELDAHMKQLKDCDAKIESLEKDVTRLVALAKTYGTDTTKWKKHAAEWEALSDDYWKLLVKEKKVSVFNFICTIGFLAIIVLQQLGVIPCLK